MKVISIEVTTLTQAVGQARNLKSKTIEIGCSNKNDVPNMGKKTKKFRSHEMQQMLGSVDNCVYYCYICQTILRLFVNVNFKSS